MRKKWKKTMRNRIPKTLDNPVRAIGIPIDTLIIGGVIWVILFLFDVAFIGLVSGVVSAYLYQRYRKRSFIRVMARMLYWYLPASLNPIKQGVKGYERKIIVKGYKDGK